MPLYTCCKFSDCEPVMRGCLLYQDIFPFQNGCSDKTRFTILTILNCFLHVSGLSSWHVKSYIMCWQYIIFSFRHTFRSSWMVRKGWWYAQKMGEKWKYIENNMLAFKVILTKTTWPWEIFLVLHECWQSEMLWYLQANVRQCENETVCMYVSNANPGLSGIVEMWVVCAWSFYQGSQADWGFGK